MKKLIKIGSVGLVVALLVILLLPLVPAVSVLAGPEVQRYEYYNAGEDTAGYVTGACWEGQTFTPSIAHRITSVKLKAYREGTPGKITVSIRDTGEDGHPTGEDLCVGTTDGNTIPEYPDFEWREITLGTGYDLSVGTKYSIVVRAESLSYSFCWLEDEDDGEYPGGCVQESINYGVDWDFFTYPNCDYMFEEWGTVPPTETHGVYTLAGVLPYIFVGICLIASMALLASGAALEAIILFSISIIIAAVGAGVIQSLIP